MNSSGSPPSVLFLKLVHPRSCPPERRRLLFFASCRVEEPSVALRIRSRIAGTPRQGTPEQVDVMKGHGWPQGASALTAPSCLKSACALHVAENSSAEARSVRARLQPRRKSGLQPLGDAFSNPHLKAGLFCSLFKRAETILRGDRFAPFSPASRLY